MPILVPHVKAINSGSWIKLNAAVNQIITMMDRILHVKVVLTFVKSAKIILHVKCVLLILLGNFKWIIQFVGVLVVTMIWDKIAQV